MKSGLAGYPDNPTSVGEDQGPVVAPVRYGFRSFDRQWIIPNNRLINRPNSGIWAAMSPVQLHLTALHRTAPRSGPAATITALVPDLDHYKGSFGGRVFPLWLDHAATTSNVHPGVVEALGAALGVEVSPEAVFAYIVGMVSNPAFTARFADDLSTPGLRVPVTASGPLFERAVGLERRVIWLQSYRERCVDPTAGRSGSRPRLSLERAPKVPAEGTISTVRDEAADTLGYDAAMRRLLVGTGYVDNVTSAMWKYTVSGMGVVSQWFSYRRAHRDRPLIGDKRPPSRLEKVLPGRWLPEYTTDLLDMLHVLGLLIDLEPEQAVLLDDVCGGALLSESDLAEMGAFDLPVGYPSAPFRAEASPADAPNLFE